MDLTSLFPLFVAVIILLDLVIASMRFGISPMPSNAKMRHACTQLIQRENLCHHNTLIYVAGSGFGGLARAVAKANPNAKVIGIEGAYMPWLYSKIRHEYFHAGHLTFVQSSFKAFAFKPNTLVVAYLYPKGTQALYKLLQSAAPIDFISLGFAVNYQTPQKSHTVPDFWTTKAYWYHINNALKQG